MRQAKGMLKEKYGDENEILTVHIKQIMNLPNITGNNSTKVNEFYETLAVNVQAIRTMGKLEAINGYARLTLDKLAGIRADIVREDKNWKEWAFPELVTNLQAWLDRNMVEREEEKENSSGRGGRFPGYNNNRGGFSGGYPDNKRDQEDRRRYGGNHRQYMQKDNDRIRREMPKNRMICVYCGSMGHNSTLCSQVLDVASRREILKQKKVCFNCTKTGHLVKTCWMPKMREEASHLGMHDAPQIVHELGGEYDGRDEKASRWRARWRRTGWSKERQRI